MVDDGSVRRVVQSKMGWGFWKSGSRKHAAPFLLEKTTKKDGIVRYCQNEPCNYKLEVDNTELTSDTIADSTVPA